MIGTSRLCVWSLKFFLPRSVCDLSDWIPRYLLPRSLLLLSLPKDFKLLSQ